MQRIALIFCLTTLALPAAARAEAPDPPTLEAGLTSCVTGVTMASRSATFSASMPARAGASVLAMRFELERRRGKAWNPVTASTFGRWERSAPDAAGFVYDKRVEGLTVLASYRATVSFRWYDASGHVVREVRRKTPVCRQPELRPDLEPVQIVPGTAQPDGTATYAVSVRNTGVAAAPPSRLMLSVGGVALETRVLPGLAALSSATVTFVGRACRPGETLRAAVDAADEIDEIDEAENALVQRCIAG